MMTNNNNNNNKKMKALSLCQSKKITQNKKLEALVLLEINIIIIPKNISIKIKIYSKMRLLNLLPNNMIVVIILITKNNIFK